MFLGSGLAYAGEGPYTKSAHGNTIYGVDRTGTSATLGAYDQDDNACFYCQTHFKIRSFLTTAIAEPLAGIHQTRLLLLWKHSTLHLIII